MSPKSYWSNRPRIGLAIFTIVAGLTVFMSGQQRGPMADSQNSMYVPILAFGPQEDSAGLPGLPDDWTHHHLVFSDPGTEEDSFRNDNHDDWVRVVEDPRYVMQQLKRRQPARGPWAEYVDRMNEMAFAEVAAEKRDDMGESSLGDFYRLVRGHRIATRTVLNSDWSMDLGGSVGAGQYPAKFSYSTTNQGQCANAGPPDFVVYNTGKAGAVSAATGALTFSAAPNTGTGSTHAITIGSIAYNYTVTTGSVGTPASGQCLVSTGGSEANAESYLAGAITNGFVGTAGSSTTWVCYSGDARNSAVTDVVLSTTANTITMSSSTPGSAGNFTLSTGSAVTGVAASGGSNGATGQANIIAYDNIYTGCPTTGGHTVPQVYWSYYTGTGAAYTSPIISFNGNQVAFIESPTTGASTLRLIQFAGGEGIDYNQPATPDATYTNTTAGASGNTAWTSCPSGRSCMISVAFQTEANPDTISAPWYDYASDTLWVGDSGGYLHKFTGVLRGTPGEATTGGWPVNRSACGGRLASPVYDNTHSLVYVGDFCGYLDSITSSGGVTLSKQVGYGAPDIGDGPLVDPVALKVYIAVASDSSHAGVFQFPYNYTSSTTPSEAQVGSPDTGRGDTYIYAGSFDNAYFTSTAATPTGHLWVCGDVGGNPELYPISITNGTMSTGAITAATTVSGTSTPCSPVSESCNNGASSCTSSTGTDYIFVSPQSQPSPATVSGCSASEGCVISYKVSGTTPTLSGASGFAGGASGMIIDTSNTGGSLTTFQLYFGTVSTSATCAGVSTGGAGNGSGGCGVQASASNPANP